MHRFPHIFCHQLTLKNIRQEYALQKGISYHSLHLPSALGGVEGGGGGLSHFSECLHRRDLYQYIKSGFWVGLGIFGGGGFFRWDLKTPCIKNSECEYQAKNDTNCNFSNFSILVPYPNKFLVVCICILLFHGTYSHYPLHSS